MATIEGSFITMPSPRTYTRVLAVPRSIARSLEKSPARKFSNMAVRSRLVATHYLSNCDYFASLSPEILRLQDPLCFQEDGEHWAPRRLFRPRQPALQSFRLFEPARRSHGRTNGAELWQHGGAL